MEHLQTETQTAKWNLRPDADILNLAFKLLQDIPANYTHIKGHQDKVKSDKPLSFWAQMNIMADELATQQCEKMTALRMLKIVHGWLPTYNQIQRKTCTTS
jgi:hypothetical protein